MIPRLSLQNLRLSRHLLRCDRPLSTLSRAIPHVSASLTRIQSTAPPTRAIAIPAPVIPLALSQRRPYSSAPASGKSESDKLVEELQELYEIATDEFEIASESTDNAAVYGESDRECARDALNHLQIVYTLYSTDMSSPECQEVLKEQERLQLKEKEEGVEGESKVVTTNFNPAEISAEAREEVRKRVGQRVRELRSAVEAMEAKAMED